MTQTPTGVSPAVTASQSVHATRCWRWTPGGSTSSVLSTGSETTCELTARSLTQIICGTAPRPGNCRSIIPALGLLTSSALEALRNALYKFKTYLLTYLPVLSTLSFKDTKLIHSSQWIKCTIFHIFHFKICILNITVWKRQYESGFDFFDVGNTLVSSNVVALHWFHCRDAEMFWDQRVATKPNWKKSLKYCIYILYSNLSTAVLKVLRRPARQHL